MKTIPTIELDMAFPPSERFTLVPKRLLRAGAVLARRSNAEIGDKRLQRIAEVILDSATAFRNPYRGEIAAWAKLLDIRRKESLTANFAYELSQAASWGAEKYERIEPWVRVLGEEVSQLWNKVLTDLTIVRGSHLACTAGAAYYPKLGNVLVRAMDWDLPGLGRHTVLWHHTGTDAGDYYSVGWPGYVGVLSGNAPRRFAASINLAFPISAPTMDWPPSHLLRWVFDNCTDFDDALATLHATPVCFPALVMLVGVHPGQAAVAELTPGENRIHAMSQRRPIAIANDYLSGDWREGFGLPGESVCVDEKGDRDENRRNRMLTELNRRKPNTIERALASVQVDWIDNECTMQQMAFIPATGECIVIGLAAQTPVGVVGVGPVATD
jgi:hypothetical protein